MIVLRDADAVPEEARPALLAMGSFRSLHRGHAAVLRVLRHRADQQNARALVICARPQRRVARLASLRQRLQFFAAHGVDVVLLGRSVGRSAGDLAALERCRVIELVSGDGSQPRPSGARLALVEPVEHDGVRIGDAAVAAAVKAADLALARALLGRSYAVDGRVVHGFHRGAPLGIPTANLRVRDLTLPPDGVYAVRGAVRGAAVSGVANIGFKPTFGDRERSVETHLFDFSADIYGEILEIAFAQRIRDERKFSGVDQLLAQIRLDMAAARRILAA